MLLTIAISYSATQVRESVEGGHAGYYLLWVISKSGAPRWSQLVLCWQCTELCAGSGMPTPQDLAQAARTLASQVQQGLLDASDINEALLESRLSTSFVTECVGPVE
jgi:hypothetical protein